MYKTVTAGFLWMSVLGSALAVAQTNQPPFAAADTVSTTLNTAVTVDVTVNDVDPDGDPLVLAEPNPILKAPSHGTAIKVGAGSIRYTPERNFTGTDSFRYRVTDGRGGVASATVTVTVEEAVNPVDEDLLARPDFATTSEDQAVTINVVANDFSTDGNDVIRITSVTRPPSNGTAVRSSSTEITYTPDPELSGTDTFEYEISDGLGLRARADVTVTVEPVNDPPIAVDDSATTDQDVAVPIVVTANDSDPEGDPLELSPDNPIPSPPSNGMAVQVNATTIRYTPATGFTGTDSFRYRITDGNGGLAAATVRVTVLEAVNNPPTARDDTASTDEDVAVTIDVTANDSDPDGDAVRVANANTFPQPPVHGTALKVDNSTIRYTPDADFAGTETFTYRITDGKSTFDEATVTVTVNEVNDPPVARDDTASTVEGQAVTIELTANDTDVDGDSVRLPASPFVTPPSNGVVARDSGSTVTYTPSLGFSGTDSFEYEVTDDRGGSDTAVVTVTVSPADNNPPVAVDDAVSTDEDVAVTINVIANDSDPDGDAVQVADANTFPQPPVHGMAVKVDNSSIRYTPDADFAGTDTFTYRVTDGNGAFDMATVTVAVSEVNDPPVARNDSASTVEGQAVPIEVTANDTDVDGDRVRMGASPFVVPPSNGTVARDSESTVTYTPDPGFSGTDSFTYEVTDDRGGFDTAVVTVTVSGGGGGNTAPTAVDDTASTSAATPIPVNVTANDSDPDGDPVTLTAAPIVIAPANGSAVRTSDSSIRYTPAVDFTGTDSLRYEITDGRGGFATATVTITVTGGGGGGDNTPPTARDDSASTEQETGVTINVTANDTDPDGDQVTLTTSPIVTLPGNGTAVRVSDTSVRYTPEAGFSGTDTFRYEITDGRDATAMATVTVSVARRNSPPTAVNDTATTNEDVETSINVTANDTDPDGDPLRVTAILSLPSNGTAAIAGDTMVRYIPAADASGTDSFRYQVTDTRGGLSSALVTVTIRPVDDPPTAVDDEVETHINTPVTIKVTGNDSDPDVELVRLTAQGVVTPPSNGTSERISTTSVEYTPGDRFEGIDTFEYEIEDEGGLTARALVTVAVTNNPPMAMDDEVTILQNTVALVDVVDNDSDPDGDLVKLAVQQTIVMSPSHGTVQKVGAKKIRYTPDEDFLGEDEFIYRVDDGFDLFATATVRVTVVDDLPPAVTTANPTKITQGQVNTVQLTGSGLTGASVFIGTEKFDPEDEDRVFPFVQDVNIAANGRQMTVKIDATAPGIDGFYNLMVETPVDTIGQEVRVVPRNRPVVDLYSPSEVVPDAGFMLMITGSNLRNARVSATHPSVSIFDVDSSDDDMLTGVLSVRSGASLGPFNLVVRRNGEQISLPAAVVPRRGLTKSSTHLTTKIRQKASQSGEPMRPLPDIYLQEFSFVFQGDAPGEAGVIASKSELEELARKGVISAKFLHCHGCSCEITYGASVFRVFTIPLDLFGDIDLSLLNGLGLRFGVPAQLDLLTFTFFAEIGVRLGFNICRFSDFHFCLHGSVGLEIPRVGAEITGFGGLLHQFSCCFPFGGCFNFPEIDTQGSVDEFDLQGNQCSRVTEPLTPEPFDGRHFADVELVECCTENLRLRMAGNAFGLFAYRSERDYMEVSPEGPECCGCSATLEDQALKPTPGSAAPKLFGTFDVKGSFKNTSQDTCKYTWKLEKIAGSPTLDFTPSSGMVELPPGETFKLSSVQAKVSLPLDTPATDSGEVVFEVNSAEKMCQDTAIYCPVAENEVSSFVRWESPSTDVARFNARLGPSSTNFIDRSVSEDWTGFFDNCHFPLSNVLEFSASTIDTGGVWEIMEDNELGIGNLYGSDIIGIRQDISTTYGPRHTGGCDMGAVQHMSMSCPAPIHKVNYHDNQVEVQVAPRLNNQSLTRICRDKEGSTPGEIGCSSLH